MQDAMRCSLHVSNVNSINTGKNPVSHREAFMIATLGGAKGRKQFYHLACCYIFKNIFANVIDVNTIAMVRFKG